MLGRVVNALGQPIDGKGPIHDGQIPQDRACRIRRYFKKIRRYAAADRYQGHRLHGADRKRTARADHRRQTDRKDRHCDRYDHQSEGTGRKMYLCGDRPEGIDRSIRL